MSQHLKSELAVRRARPIVRKMLIEGDNGRGEVFFKARDVADKHEELTSRKAGKALAKLSEREWDGKGVYDIGIEEWGTARSTRWRAFYKD